MQKRGKECGLINKFDTTLNEIETSIKNASIELVFFFEMNQFFEQLSKLDSILTT